MSDMMLHGVLCMPPELWADSDIDRYQRYQRYLQASRRIEDDEAEILRLRGELKEAHRILGCCTDEELPGWLHSAIAKILTPNSPLQGRGACAESTASGGSAEQGDFAWT